MSYFKANMHHIRLRPRPSWGLIQRIQILTVSIVKFCVRLLRRRLCLRRPSSLACCSTDVCDIITLAVNVERRRDPRIRFTDARDV